jgi:hypothetical protein
MSARENQIIIFAGDRNGAPPENAITYRLTAPVPARHYVLELPPDKLMVVEINGRATPAIRVNAQGVLGFRDSGTGARRLSIRPAG